MRRSNANPRTDREAHAKERSLAVLSLMRRERLSLKPAARMVGTNPTTVSRYAGSALRQERKGGRIRVAKFDRITRGVTFLTSSGKRAGVVRDSRTASALGEHLNAVKVFVNDRDDTALSRFRGKHFRVSGQVYEFVTDRATLERLADAGELAVEGLYIAVKG